MTREFFAGLTWPAWDHPEPDPFTPEEMRGVLGWFRRLLFGFAPLAGSMGVRRLPHSPFYAYVHTLFMTGLRPSEASGLQWQDLDLTRGLLYVRRSYLRTYQAPKTRRARRTVELLPETVAVLRAIQPLHVTPDTPVFTSTSGGPIEPKSFSEHWYTSLRSVSVRMRGLYTTKDTFMSIALRVRGPLWVEKQTGVAYSTLAKHYAKWMPDGEDRDEQRRLAAAFAAPKRGTEKRGLSPTERRAGGQSLEVREIEDDSECEEGDLNAAAVAESGSNLAAKRAWTGTNGHDVDPQGPHLKLLAARRSDGVAHEQRSEKGQRCDWWMVSPMKFGAMQRRLGFWARLGRG